jgi:tetratricopeptide (TPR) repeat protein
MFRTLLLAVACIVTLALSPVAQLNGIGNLRIEVTYSNGQPATRNLLVQLMSGSSSIPVATNYTNERGITEFSAVPVGVYHVVVTGDGIQRAEGPMFEVDPRKVTQSENATVYRLDEVASKQSSRDATVDAAELQIPDKARKEFQKASDAMSHEDWNGARDKLLKAIALYPNYAAAYNNLGVVYSRLNQPAQESDALEKAIAANDRYAPAYVNFGELCIRQGDLPSAERQLKKAIELDPQNAKAYMLLADAQLLNREYDAAIASAKQAHALPHDKLALTHYISAKAYEHQNRPQDAIAELQTFLKEEPQGSRADHMREEMKQLQRQAQ